MGVDFAGTYAEPQNPTPALGAELAVQYHAVAIIRLVHLHCILARGNGETGLGDLGGDAKRAAREFLQRTLISEMMLPRCFSFFFFCGTH